jgi:hypothetical protein
VLCDFEFGPARRTAEQSLRFSIFCALYLPRVQKIYFIVSADTTFPSSISLFSLVNKGYTVTLKKTIYGLSSRLEKLKC